MDLYKKKKGITLIELVVAMAMMAIISTAMYFVMGSSYVIYNNGVHKDDVESNCRLAMIMLSTQLKTSRNAVDTAGMSDSRFDDIYDIHGNEYTGGSITKVAYIEGSDFSRKMYIIEVNPHSGIKELHRLTFSPLTATKYKVDTSSIQLLSAKDKDYYNAPANSENTVDASSRIEPHDFLIGYTPYKIIYNNYSDQCYLWAQSATGDYRFNITPISDTDFHAINDEKVADYIDSVNVEKVPNSTLCNIDIKTKYLDKSKEIRTSVFLMFAKGMIG